MKELAADAPNLLWLFDITEHRTRQGKLYLCAIKVVHFQPDHRLLHRLQDEVGRLTPIEHETIMTTPATQAA